MHIAQIAPLIESVPPRGYGGTERVVAFLTDELLRQGHEVTLFASGDSRTGARLVAGSERALRLDNSLRDPLAPQIVQQAVACSRADEFDVMHFHTDYISFPAQRHVRTPHVTTLHGRLDLPELVPVYREFRELALVSISQAQRQPIPWANWQATIHHGLPDQLLRFRPRGGEHFVFVGRISPEKRVDRAIEIARRLGRTIRIAAKIDKADRAYHDAHIRPLLQLPGVEYVGEISDAQKNDFLGSARALLFPIDWPEPFGLILIEAMACGTPVIAFGHGSVPEIVEHGRNGFIVANLEEAMEAAREVHTLSRAECRRSFDERFTSARMARDYLALYQRLIGQGPGATMAASTFAAAPAGTAPGAAAGTR